MTNRRLLLFVVAFAALASGYIWFFLAQPAQLRSELREVHSIGLAVPAALLAFCFQLRLSRISRLDVWSKEYQELLREVAVLIGRYPRDTITEDDVTTINRACQRAESLAAVIESLGFHAQKHGREPVADGSVFEVRGLLGCLSGVPPGVSIRDPCVADWESALRRNLQVSPKFIASLHR